MRRHRLSTMLALLCGLAHEAMARPGDPLGPEFQVNTYTTSYQRIPAVGPDGAGGFVVVWESEGSSGSDTSRQSIQGQRYASTGTAVGGEFQVNTYTTRMQYAPAVGPDGAGGFVVVWASGGSSGSDAGSLSIQGQRYASTGTPVGGEFQVNTYTTSYQFGPAVGPDGAGGFVVVWESVGSSGSDTSSSSIQGQRYASTGTAVGGEFQVNTYTTNFQDAPAVGPDGAGGFVVVWHSRGSSGSDTSAQSIQGQRYASTGTAVGGEFQVNTYTTSRQYAPAVGPDGAGGFVVVWHSDGSSGSDTSYRSVQGQRYASTGTAVGGEFQVNTYTTNNQSSPAVGPDGAGGFVVVWTSYGSSGSDTSYNSVHGQRYASTGTAVGGEFQVNTYTTRLQRSPAVGPDGAGGFVVVWRSEGSSGSDTSAYSIQGQRYEGPRCVTASDCDDANVCTADACVGGECTNTAVPCDEPQCVTASDCDDANVCTADACVGGECTNTAVPCDEPPCVTASDCDDGNVCTADACVGGECRETNTAAPCDDGSVCTTGEVCGDGACLPGVPLDVAAVARGVTGATETPAPCTTGKKDPQRARHVLKQLKAAHKWLDKGAKATKPSKREKLIGKAARRSAKARAVLARFAATLSPVCHAALLGQLIQAQEQIDCL